MAEWIVKHECFLEMESVSLPLKQPALTLVVLSSPPESLHVFFTIMEWLSLDSVWEKCIFGLPHFFSIFSSLSCLSLSTSLFYPMSHFFTVWSSFKNILTDIIYKNVVLLKTLMNETVALWYPMTELDFKCLPLYLLKHM